MDEINDLRRVEIAAQRDPITGAIDLSVFIDGEQVPDHEILFGYADLGAYDAEPMVLSTWRAKAWQAACEGSWAFAREVTGFFATGECDIEHVDIHPAQDAQPNVSDPRNLDVRAWFTMAKASANPNALAAARGAVAVRTFATHPAPSTTGKAEAMLAAHGTASQSVYQDLASSMQDLLTDLRHFCAARGFVLEARPHFRDDISHTATEIVAALATMPGITTQEYLRIRKEAYTRFDEEIARDPAQDAAAS